MYLTVEQQPVELVMHETGTFHGVDYTIEEVIGRRIGYRLTVDGVFLATLDSRPSARHLRDEYVLDMIEQGLVGTLCMEDTYGTPADAAADGTAGSLGALGVATGDSVTETVEPAVVKTAGS